MWLLGTRETSLNAWRTSEDNLEQWLVFQARKKGKREQQRQKGVKPCVVSRESQWVGTAGTRPPLDPCIPIIPNCSLLFPHGLGLCTGRWPLLEKLRSWFGLVNPAAMHGAVLTTLCSSLF